MLGFDRGSTGDVAEALCVYPSAWMNSALSPGSETRRGHRACTTPILKPVTPRSPITLALVIPSGYLAALHGAGVSRYPTSASIESNDLERPCRPAFEDSQAPHHRGTPRKNMGTPSLMTRVDHRWGKGGIGSSLRAASPGQLVTSRSPHLFHVSN